MLGLAEAKTKRGRTKRRMVFYEITNADGMKPPSPLQVRKMGGARQREM